MQNGWIACKEPPIAALSARAPYHASRYEQAVIAAREDTRPPILRLNGGDCGARGDRALPLHAPFRGIHSIEDIQQPQGPRENARPPVNFASFE